MVIFGRLVTLRTSVPGDVADYERWADPSLEAWETDGPWFHDDLTRLADRCRRRLAEPRDQPSVLEIDTTDSIHVGWVTVYFHEDDPHMTEVGIGIIEDGFRGRGLGSEALALWIDHLFAARGLTRIGLSTWSGNRAMTRVALRLGLKQEACIRSGCEVNGQFHDRLKFGILKSEWPVAEPAPLAGPDSPRA